MESASILDRTKKKEYTWEVEKDAMDWESGISGIKTIEQKINDLKKEGCV